MSRTPSITVRMVIALAVSLPLAHGAGATAQEVQRLPMPQHAPLVSIVDVSTLTPPTLAPGAAGAPIPIEPKPFLVPNPEQYRQQKELLRLRPFPIVPTVPDAIPDAAGAGSPLAPAVKTQFEGLANSNNGIAGASVIPPDNNLGVGPNHVFQMVNSVGRISDKSGGSASTFTLRSFFSLSKVGEADPRVIFDAQSGRWFAVYLEYTLTAVSSLRLAVSRTSDPTSFCVYQIGNPTNETFLQDYPALGVSDDKVILTYNAFAAFVNFLGAGYYVLNKANLTACTSSVSIVRIPPNSSRNSVHPAQAVSSTSNAFMLMHGGGGLTLFTVSGVPGVSSVVETSQTFAVRPWGAPPDAPQLGSPVLLDTNDDRVLSAAWRNNSLVLAGNEACIPSGDVGARSCLRVLEIRTDTNTVQQDMTFAASGTYYYFPALRPDGAGNLYVVFTASSATAFASVRMTGRLANDPLNTLQASVELRTGGGAQLDADAQGHGRMGDYAGAATDPSDPTVVWVMGEYIASTGGRTWGTYVAQLNFGATIRAAVLPLSRSIQVKGPRATAFAAIVNTGSTTAINCAPAVPTNSPAGLGIFSYQTATPTNALAGSSNTPANIAPGAIQNYVFGILPIDVIPETSLAIQFLCDNAVPAPQTPGVNNFFIVAAASPVPDTIALIATLSGDGVVRIPGSAGTQLFAIGTSNVGATGTIVVSGDTGGAALPLTLTVCETGGNGACLVAPMPSVTVNYLAGTNRSFAFFAQASGSIPFDPATNRVYARLKEAGVLRGATSAAVCTSPNAGC